MQYWRSYERKEKFEFKAATELAPLLVLYEVWRFDYVYCVVTKSLEGKTEETSEKGRPKKKDIST